MINIAIIDDHQLVMEGFISLLKINPSWRISETYQSVQEASKGLTEAIDLAIVDLSLSDGSGIAVLKHIQNTFPDTKTLVVSMYDQAHYIQDALSAGAKGYVSKKSASDDLIIAVESILEGKSFMSQDIVQQLNFNQSQDKVSKLTGREIQVLKLLARGLKPKQVALELDITPKTALVHRANIFKKFDVSNQYDLTKIALQEGLISVEQFSKA